jgi:hypothetical protein
MHTFTEGHFVVRVRVNNLQELVDSVLSHEYHLTVNASNFIQKKFKLVFVQDPVPISINVFESTNEESQEFLMLTKLEVQNALEESDEL